MAMNYYGAFPIKMDPGFVMVFRLFGTLGPDVAAFIISGPIGRKWLGWKEYGRPISVPASPPQTLKS